MLPGSAFETYTSLRRLECFTQIARPLHRCHQPKSRPNPLRCHPPIRRQQQDRAITHAPSSHMEQSYGATHPFQTRQSVPPIHRQTKNRREWHRLPQYLPRDDVWWVAPSAHHLPSSNRCHPATTRQKKRGWHRMQPGAALSGRHHLPPIGATHLSPDKKPTWVAPIGFW